MTEVTLLGRKLLGHELCTFFFMIKPFAVL